MKVVVDRDRCIGHGVCEAVSAELFVVGDDGTVQVLVDEISGETAALAALAVADCPSQALRIDED
ncbi:ferredoxin [Nocardia uniformis]|uniref:Ferredoxin n=1 Tax=Nocardia uniformis TaxID=53432 RepID=A0A849BY05_9NOCA|nr:ferredoxin [Nocardia uniformis]NNH68557.1 ferredoxin [Nocardia uniformis]